MAGKQPQALQRVLATITRSAQHKTSLAGCLRLESTDQRRPLCDDPCHFYNAVIKEHSYECYVWENPGRGLWVKGNASPYTITEHRVLELIPVLGSQPAGDVSHKPGGRLPLLSARAAVTLATLKAAATNFAAC